MTEAVEHIDPTFDRPECRPEAAPQSSLPLPKRIWLAEPPQSIDVVTLGAAFQCQGDCGKAVLWAAADGDFSVFVNNEQIEEIQDNPLARRLIGFDVTDVIKRGVNTIEIHVKPFGDGPHCLIAVMDAEVDGQTLRVVSDDSWTDRSWETQTHRHYGVPTYWD